MEPLSSDHKYELQVIKQSRAIKVDREYKDKMKELYGDKIISKFSKDAVECPVIGKTVSFLICMGCPNYVRRYKGAVHCKGDPLQS
ncbi:MAG: hypothetical protein BA066_02825 [Candidatus Korarchaeota archaeon NZ13-K]|nr:MAG: hypothetical protein BA066_02825 [Candidatus Korarchaeota archaeon NZ13-K]